MPGDIQEVTRLAQNAQNTATNADHKADTAIILQAAHEKLCAERYNNIDNQLKKIETAQTNSANTHSTAIEKIYIVLNELRTSDSKSVGQRTAADHIFRYVCLGVAALVGIYGVARHGG